MPKKTYTAIAGCRIAGRVYRPGEPVTCDPKDLEGVERCVREGSPGLSKAEKAKAIAEAEADAQSKVEAFNTAALEAEVAAEIAGKAKAADKEVAEANAKEKREAADALQVVARTAVEAYETLHGK